MIRWLVKSTALLLALVSAFVFLSARTYAGPSLGSEQLTRVHERTNDAPPQAASDPGYTLLYSFSSDPQDITYTASFTPDVQSIYAWATIVEENGADHKQFTVDTQFISPDGTVVDSAWYGQDTGTVTTYPADPGTYQDENVARRFVDVAGTPNAQLKGQWTVNYRVGGKLIATGNFTLEDATDVSQGDATDSAEQALTDQGYDVIEFKEQKGKNNNLFAYVIMTPISQDLYSSDTTQQIVDGFAALRQTFPDSGTLYTFLRHDPRYEVAYWADPVDVDLYIKNNDFDAFSQNISVDVWDNDTGTYLGNASKDFILKNFGAGTYQSPISPPLSKSTNRIGSIRVVVSPSNLPADGVSKAIVTVTVYDKKNQPVADAQVDFEVTGASGGTIRPKVTSTDENGEADAVFTVSKTDGAVTITASSGGATGTGVITVGKGSSDSAADNVIGTLKGQGLNATRVAYLDDAKTTVGVLIDLGTTYNINAVSGPIIYGMTALRTNYPDAKTLVVIVPYQQNLLMFPATAAEFDNLGTQIAAAKTDADKNAAFTAFLTLVFGKADYVDHNGNKISTFKDFYNKNFSGG